MAATRLRTVIMIGYGSLILLFIAVAAAVYANADRVAGRVEEVERLHRIDREVASLRLSVSIMQRAARGQMLDARQSRVDNFNRALRDYESSLGELRRTELEARQQALLGRITEQGRAAIDLLRTDFQLAAENKVEQAIAIFRSGRNDLLVNALSASVDEFLANDDQTLRDRQVMMHESLEWMGQITWGGTLLAALAAIAGGLWMVRRSGSIIGKATSEMISATTQIAASVEEQERVASDQAAAVTQTTATMDELGVSSRKSAEQAENVSSAARQTTSLTQEGSATMDEAVKAMQQLKQKVDAIAAQILSLSDQASQIGIIANLVSELAGETNMLALNAAVEAARAGEAGRGFAVVASEVRKLAEQSRKSAERANALVGEIQKATNSAVMVTEEGTRTVDNVQALARQAGGTFGNIAGAAASVFETAQQVVLNGRQQASAIAQVVNAMTSLKAGAKQTAEGLAQTRAGIQQINAAAHQVSSIV